MRCPDEEKFAQYAEGKLSGEERAEFLDHISKCSECSTLCALTCGNMDNLTTCPDEETMSGFAEGKLSRRQREALLKHMAVCKTCSAEFYCIRRLKLAEKPVKKASGRKRNIYQLVALAAMIALIVGFTGVHNLFDEQAEDRYVIMESESPQYENDALMIEESMPAAAPPAPPAPPTPSAIPPMPMLEMAFKDEQGMGQGARIKEQAVGGKALKAPVYEVIFNGYDGDITEIIKLIQSIAGKDEESAAAITESGTTVIKECSSMEEAQGVKKELEAAGAKIEIKEK